tara:strand:- start:246309 stop:246764 length:456 start_codon:yes stop_codon:yes gene_type:complete
MRLLQILTLVLTLGISALPAQADTQPVDGTPLQFAEAYAYQTAPNQKNGAAFFKVQNLLGEDVKIIAARADIAAMVELHTHSMDGGNMSMFPVDFFTLAAGETHELKPTGDHIMLMMLKQPLKVGEGFDLNVTLDTGEEFSVPVSVLSLSE